VIAEEDEKAAKASLKGVQDKIDGAMTHK